MAFGRLAHRLDEILLAVVDGARRRRGLSRPSHFSALPTVTMTSRAEGRRHLIAVVPMPLAPPWIKQPFARLQPPRSNTLFQTVKTVSGSAAASTIERPSAQAAWSLSGATAISRHSRRHSTSAQTVIAKLESRRAGPERRDVAGDFEPEQIGGAFRRRIETLALQHVGPVDARGLDLDQDLAGARLAAPAVSRHEHFRSARRPALR